MKRVVMVVVLLVASPIVAQAQRRTAAAENQPAVPQVLSHGCVTRALTCGNGFTGSLDSTSCKSSAGMTYDQFTLTLQKDNYLTLQVEAFSAIAPFVAVYDTTGRLLASASGFSFADLRDFRTPYSGAFTILVGSLVGRSDLYTVDVVCCPVSALVVGVQQSGALDASDCKLAEMPVDRFAFSATEGSPLRITYTPTYHPYLEIAYVDAFAGTWRGSESVEALTFTYWPEFTGTHHLALSQGAAATSGGTYTIRIDPMEPEACRRRSARH